MEIGKLVAGAFVKAQAQFGPVLKDSTNPHFRSKYACLGSCMDSVMGALNDNGLAVSQKTHDAQNGVAVETVLIHESGESISFGVLTIPAAKHDPQGYGAALTYARRYSLMAAFGIAPEDDDGNLATESFNKCPQPLAEDSRLWLNKGTKDWADVCAKIAGGERTIEDAMKKYKINKELQAELKSLLIGGGS